MSADINRTIITGRLTRDPELRQTPAGTSVTKLRVAFTTRRKSGEEWSDHSNYIDVTVWGGQGESVARHLAKGRAVAIDGRLEWREWEGDSGKRQAIELVADAVRFLGPKPDQAEPEPAGAAAGSSDDIPF